MNLSTIIGTSMSVDLSVMVKGTVWVINLPPLGPYKNDPNSSCQKNMSCKILKVLMGLERCASYCARVFINVNSCFISSNAFQLLTSTTLLPIARGGGTTELDHFHHLYMSMLKTIVKGVLQRETSYALGVPQYIVQHQKSIFPNTQE